MLKRKDYSWTCFLPKGYAVDTKALYQAWLEGVKLYIITNCDDIYKKLQNKFAKNHFHVEIYFVKVKLKHAIYKNGDLQGSSRKVLKNVDKKTSFNLPQYLLEHAKPEKDIMVMAGAGTGKTTSMIRRISYLIHTHQLNAATLPKEIYMITFTKAAAAHMKEKLEQYFERYHALTGDEGALKLQNAINKMFIGTIHSLALKILNYKRDFKIRIVCTKEAKDEELRIVLKWGGEGDEHVPIFLEMMEQLYDKGIDPDDRELDWGYCKEDRDFHKVMKRALRDGSENAKAVLDGYNEASLKDLMIKMKSNTNCLHADFNISPSYIFVDEFQDTDDTQIDIIKGLQDRLGFNLFAVGDAKQCIYRFRGANSKAFDTLRQGRWRSFLKFHLNKNYRSDAGLLREMDAHFARWGALKLLDYKRKDRLVGVKTLDRQCGIESFGGDLIELIEKSHGETAILTRSNWQAEEVKELIKSSTCNPSATQVMTIHKAKGLEFDTVILPYLNHSLKSHSRKGDVDVVVVGNRIGYMVKTKDGKTIMNNYYEVFKEIEDEEKLLEEIRILYVAMTRAKRRVIWMDDGEKGGIKNEPKTWRDLFGGANISK
ncbi:MAG: UvrD family DEAD/DEAH box helicase [Defluviitaleaceae bacterium]|nr:UvrD family DEAD/DEAH box helicase [Defluviitaleaceae bacterium]